jgi:hypothetical protein
MSACLEYWQWKANLSIRGCDYGEREEGWQGSECRIESGSNILSGVQISVRVRNVDPGMLSARLGDWVGDLAELEKEDGVGG